MRTLTLFTASLVTVSAVANGQNFLTSKTPYQPKQDYQSYSQVPQGYQLAMIQHVARHGSRGLSSADDDVLMMDLLLAAKADNALTPLGEKLITQVAKLTQVQEKIGYGKLSTIGKQEHYDMAQRLVARHPDFFTAETERQVLFSNSGRSRAAQSGEAFRQGLLKSAPVLADQFQVPYVSKATLYFHKAEGPHDYKEYKDSDPRIKNAMAQIENSEKSADVSESILSGLFTQPFIDKLKQGKLHFEANNGEDTLDNGMDAVSALYGMYAVIPDLAKDSDDLDMTPFISDENAAWLAYMDDADSFYGRGPGFTGDDITYRAADALFSEMLLQIDSLIDDTEDAPLASFRFTHAQVLMPVATWLQFDGTEVTVDEGEIYTYETNPWRSADIAPMAANVQWEVYQNNEQNIVVRMLHNEKEVTFPAMCKPLEGTTYFYEFKEVKACLNALHGEL
ncbi:histidine phosphatase family protein [Salinimonas sp. HHU 13199]|uniref:Multiple inositol polyphosphate phosphatase 1 n=1 Tax=Salinimonas profundi TaxID=2729140 RepID=A0ABR8LH79_9ALTE|nr:histidine-type phosphatase [Salinimonas profundi]MBD3585610.1 histidine phosphatase family protein [Salinimonas profundi]